MARPPKVPRQEKIRNARIFVAEQILEVGAPPAVRKLNEALGYSQAGSARNYKTVSLLSDDPSVIYIQTDWQHYLFPIEVYNAMVKAAKEVLVLEGVDITKCE
jgi:hypothetical protein